MVLTKSRILAYHSIEEAANEEPGADLYRVSLENFLQQMQYLSVVRRPSSVVPHPSSVIRPEVTITFDDGDITNYKYAYPVLKELSLNAVFFVLVGKVGTKGFMDWPQIKELQAAGMVIGSHGLTHRILTELADQEIDKELKESKRILEEHLGSTVEYLSIPRGFFNKKIEAMAKAAGYKRIYTSNFSDCGAFKAGRISVKRDWDFDYFKRVVNNGLSPQDIMKERLKNAIKRMVGSGSYDRMRSGVLSKKNG